MPRHSNSFDFLRLLFAVLVIITHSELLTGHGEDDFLYRWSGGQTNCSYLGVRGFFVISGFLIFKSLQRSSSSTDYLKKRALRIFPALVAMLVVVTFAAGPFLTELHFSDYFSSPASVQYIASALRIPGIQKTASLPGLFVHNPGGSAVNGSLWTIWFELLFYIALLAAFPLRKDNFLLKWILPGCWLTLFAVFLLAHPFLDSHIFPMTGMSAEVAVDLALYFLAGSALTLVHWECKHLHLVFLIAGVIILACGLWLQAFHYLRYIGIPLLVIAAGHCHVLLLDRLRRLGEPSYGIYIYAYPVQQAIIQLLHPVPLVVTLIAIPITVLLGLGSWHLIEAPFLSLKKKA
jgi:peptidoglycan/LPS O-acetylase OafA/YrhL